MGRKFLPQVSVFVQAFTSKLFDNCYFICLRQIASMLSVQLQIAEKKTQKAQ